MRTTSATNRQRARIALCVPAAAVLLAALTLGSCCKDLCYDHDTHSFSVKVRVLPEWEQEWEREYDYNWEALWRDEWTREYDDLRPETADGIRALAYAEGSPRHENNLPAEGGRLALSEGMFDILFYNNDTEYIVFNDITTAATASATTRSITRGGFAALHAEERTVNQPDMLYGSFQEEYATQRTLEETQLPVTLRPLVYTYMVRFEFSHGQKYVALARGALAGMAESVYLNDGHTGPDAATVMFDCTVEPYGAEALVRSFGVPDYPGDHYNRAEGDDAPTGRHYTLNLGVRLYNGKIKNFEFDVTGQVEGQPRGGIITVTGIEISDEEGLEGSGAFDVTVEGWGDYIDIPLPIS